MKIGIDARLFGPRVGGGGLGRYVEQLVRHLEELDHENEFIVFLRRENWNEYTPTAANFKKVLAPWRWYTLAEQIRMPRLVAQQKLDIIHYPHFNVPIFARTPFVVTIHDLNLLEYPKARITNLDPVRFWTKYFGYRFVLAFALKNAKKIITVSDATRQAILNRFPISPEKIVTTPLGYTPPLKVTSLRSLPPVVARKSQSIGFVTLLTPREVRGDEGSYVDEHNPLSLPLTLRGGARQSHYLLAVGNAYPHKNLSGLLHAFKIIRATLPDLKLVLVGPDDRFRARIKKETTELGLTSTVIFTGFVNDDELDVLYRGAAAYIMPSFLEGFGFPGLEAQARGIPVVASDLPVLKETLADAAVYVNPRDPIDIAYAILNLLKNENYQNVLKKAGEKNIKRFDWRSAATETLTIYKNTRG